MRDDLAVGPGEVRARAHGSEIGLPLRRIERRAAELAVRQRYVVLTHRGLHGAQGIVADLVAAAARARVDEHRELAREEPEDRGRARLKDLRDFLKFQEMVAAAQGAQLVLPPLHRARAGALRVRLGQGPAVLHGLQVGTLAVAPLHRPARALEEDFAQFLFAQAQRTFRADPGRHGPEQRVHELGEDRFDLRGFEVGAQQAHAAGDVVAHGAGADDPVFGPGRGHASDRHAVAPVRVGHGHGIADDARQGRHIGHLLGDLLRLELGEHPLRGVDQAGNAHGPGARQFPAIVVELAESCRDRHEASLRLPFIILHPQGRRQGEPAGAAGRPPRPPPIAAATAGPRFWPLWTRGR